MAGAAERRRSRRRRAALIAAGRRSSSSARRWSPAPGRKTEPAASSRPSTHSSLPPARPEPRRRLRRRSGRRLGPDFSAWVALALAAASVNPHDQTKPGRGQRRLHLPRRTRRARTERDHRLRARTDGRQRRRISAAAARRRQPGRRGPPGPDPGTGAFSHEAGGRVPGMNDTIFAILALAPIKRPAIEPGPT